MLFGLAKAGIREFVEKHQKGPLRESRFFCAPACCVTKGLLRTHLLENVCLRLLTLGSCVDRMSAIEISAPRSRFLDGLCKTQGYNVVTNGERVTVAFEPWALEQVDAFEMPCLRLDFRQVDGRIVLERFTVENAGEEHVVNLEAARDALQAWMDSMAD